MIYEIRSNITNSLTVRVNPNTRYQVRICTLNKAGCGRLSSFSLGSQCDSAPILSKNIFQNSQPVLSRLLSNHQFNNYPQITSASHSSNDEQQEQNQRFKNENSDKQSSFDLSKSNQLILNLPRLNERDGRILCYRIVSSILTLIIS